MNAGKIYHGTELFAVDEALRNFHGTYNCDFKL